MTTTDPIRLSLLETITLALVTIGAINWGLVGIGGFVDANLNLVDLILGAVPAAENLVYVLVGLAGLYLVVMGLQRAKLRWIGSSEPERA